MNKSSQLNMIEATDVLKDIDLIMWSTELSNLYRFTHQRFWEKETRELEHALRIDGFNNTPRTESVAEHSWHIADTALIIAPRFNELDTARCVMHAILHDKLEILTGDKSPIGRDGKGTNTHAFNNDKKVSKEEQERDALQKYIKKVNNYASPLHEQMLLDTIECKSVESKFIKAIDKIHPLTYILRKKGGKLVDEHIEFTLKYSSQYHKYYPLLEPYFIELVNRLFNKIAKERECTVEYLEKKFLHILQTEQLDLFR